jgi:DNA-binding transcriptional ArsR family regulator
VIVELLLRRGAVIRTGRIEILDNEGNRFDHHRIVRPPVRPDRMLYRLNDNRPSHSRNSGASRGACESYYALSAPRWPCLTASELAFAARITPQTASTHLAKLTEAGLLSVIPDGRHRYFRLSSRKVVEMLDGIVSVALPTAQGRTSAGYRKWRALPRFRCVQLHDGCRARDRRRHDGRRTTSVERELNSSRARYSACEVRV